MNHNQFVTKKNSAIIKVNNNIQVLLSYLHISQHFKNTIVERYLLWLPLTLHMRKRYERTAIVFFVS